MNLVERVKTLWNLFTSGDLKKTDKWILVLALAYIISPIDIIPDVVPVVGFVDDLLMVLLALRHITNKPASEEQEAVAVKVKVS